VDVDILHIVRTLIFFTCKPHEAVLIQKYRHWVNYARHKHIDAKIVLVLLPQGWMLDVLLHYVGVILIFVLWFLHLVRIVWVVVLGVSLGHWRVAIARCCVLVFFLPQLLVLVELLLF
jgi:hypothetical protein